jgi:hypothetical protein
MHIDDQYFKVTAARKRGTNQLGPAQDDNRGFIGKTMREFHRGAVTFKLFERSTNLCVRIART